MKPPNFPNFRDSFPSSQLEHALGLISLSVSGKRWGPSSSFSLSITSVILSSLASLIDIMKLLQNSVNTSFQFSFPSDTSSSFVSRSAVNEYSTYFAKKLCKNAVTTRPLSSGKNLLLSIRT